MRYLFVEVAYFFIMILHKIKHRDLIIQFRARANPHAKFMGKNKLSHHSYFSGELGYASYVGERSIVLGKIGKYCSIAGNVTFLTATHPVKEFVSSHPCFYSLKKQSGFSYVSKQKFDEHPRLKDSRHSIEVGNDVYIGYGATIIGPLKIGDGAVIAAGSVVTGDVPPFAIVGGVPAKKIKDRFTEEQIRFLKEFKWWDRSPEWLRDHAEQFESIECFVEKNK